jgi:hypothetical protein
MTTAFRGAAGEGEQPFLAIGFGFRGEELPGWTLETLFSTNASARVPHLIATFRRGPSQAIRIDVFEATSHSEARLVVDRLLQQFEAPIMSERSPAPVGETCFEGPEETPVLFVRGNLVVLVRQADLELVPAAELSRILDHFLTSQPDGASESLKVPPTSTGTEGQVVAHVDLSGASATDHWFKVVAENGEIEQSQPGVVTWRGEAGAVPRLRVVEVPKS